MTQAYSAVGVGVVQRVLLCDRYQRDRAGYRAVATSLPGHLIQLTLSGRTTHEVSGRRYTLAAGHLVWFHEDEMVRIEVHEAPWSFYTLNFIAPSLTPPPFEQRVRRVGAAIRNRFASLLAAWRDLDAAPAVRELRVQSQLLGLLAELSVGRPEPFAMDPSASLWWAVETTLRQDLSQPVSLSRLTVLSGRSQATLARACRSAVGLPPMKRVKQVRMSMARGLLQRSGLRVKEIAARVGYGRVHEFSRDYRKHFGIPPSAQRRVEQP